MSALKRGDFFTHKNPAGVLVSYRVERSHRDGTVTAVARYFVTAGQERCGWIGTRCRFHPVLVPVVLVSHTGSI